jgi:hypothetical protein
MEEEATGKDINDDNFVNEENMDTHDINLSSPMDNLELVSFDLDSYATINSPSLTEMNKNVFLLLVDYLVKHLVLKVLVMCSSPLTMSVKILCNCKEYSYRLLWIK